MCLQTKEAASWIQRWLCVGREKIGFYVTSEISNYFVCLFFLLLVCMPFGAAAGSRCTLTVPLHTGKSAKVLLLRVPHEPCTVVLTHSLCVEAKCWVIFSVLQKSHVTRTRSLCRPEAIWSKSREFWHSVGGRPNSSPKMCSWGESSFWPQCAWHRPSLPFQLYSGALGWSMLFFIYHFSL